MPWHTDMAVLLSIREFCDLQMPILMFDKDGNYCVLRLEDVGPPSGCSSPWADPC